jgi:hypothetical protein
MLRNISHFTDISYFQEEVTGSQSVVYALKDLLSGVSETEHFIIAQHPKAEGAVKKHYKFQVKEEAGVKFIHHVTLNHNASIRNIIDNPDWTSEDYLAPAMVERIYSSVSKIKIIKSFEVRENSEENSAFDGATGSIAVTKGVLHLLENPKKTVGFVLEDTATTLSLKENYREICIGSINRNKCFRWGSNGGDSSIIPSGRDCSMQAPFVASWITAAFHSGQGYHIWRLSQIEKNMATKSKTL